jgi:histidinol-phosphatase (PHP family)
MRDSHVHLWRHGGPTVIPTVEELEQIVDAARRQGIDHIVIAEHFYRFREARRITGEFWLEDGCAALRDATAAVMSLEQTANIDAYVDAILAAQSRGLPVSLGLEVDFLPGRGAEINSYLRSLPLDVVLGAVHWLDAWLFDAYEDPIFARPWQTEDPNAVWETYVAAVEEMCRNGWCDVVAHCDIIKLTGRLPEDRRAMEVRIADAILTSDIAVELSSAGWRKPIEEQYPSSPLVAELLAGGASFVLGSDAHERHLIGYRFEDLSKVARGLPIVSFERRLRSEPMDGAVIDLAGDSDHSPGFEVVGRSAQITPRALNDESGAAQHER